MRTPDRRNGTPVEACCEYCDQPATLIGRDTADQLCATCGAEQYAHPAHSLARLSPTTLRRYGRH